jgi:hypothetical protein
MWVGMLISFHVHLSLIDELQDTDTTDIVDRYRRHLPHKSLRRRPKPPGRFLGHDTSGMACPSESALLGRPVHSIKAQEISRQSFPFFRLQTLPSSNSVFYCPEDGQKLPKMRSGPASLSTPTTRL